jgi:hypothetical protein
MSVGGEDYQLKVTVAALKKLLAQLYSIVYTLAKLGPEDVLTIHKGLKEGLQKHPLVHSSDPAISDIASDDVAREMARILDGVEKQLAKAAARKKAPEEPS